MEKLVFAMILHIYALSIREVLVSARRECLKSLRLCGRWSRLSGTTTGMHEDRRERVALFPSSQGRWFKRTSASTHPRLSVLEQNTESIEGSF